MKRRIALASTLIISFFCSFGAVVRAEEAGDEAAPTEAATPRMHKGTVEQILNSDPYVYLKVREGDDDLWIAVQKAVVHVGDVIWFPHSPPLLNFTSKALKKNFDEIMFVPEIEILKK